MKISYFFHDIETVENDHTGARLLLGAGMSRDGIASPEKALRRIRQLLDSVNTLLKGAQYLEIGFHLVGVLMVSIPLRNDIVHAGPDILSPGTQEMPVFLVTDS